MYVVWCVGCVVWRVCGVYVIDVHMHIRYIYACGWCVMCGECVHVRMYV